MGKLSGTEKGRMTDTDYNELLMDTGKELTREEALDILSAPGYNAYGATRMYGVIGEGECKGQVTSIKSTHYLEKYTYDFIYTLTNDGVPIRKA